MVLSSERRECANIAIASATACLKIVLEEPSIREAVIGVPLYLHTNIVFAAVFLMKMLVRWRAAHFEQQDPALTVDLVGQIITLLQDGKASERHLAFHIAKGLSTMLGKIKEQSLHNESQYAASNTNHSPHSSTDVGANPQWPAIGFPQTSMREAIDLYAINEEYFPLDMFNLTAQMPG